MPDTSPATLLRQRFDDLRARIDALATRHGRDPGGVTLLAVSKTRAAAELRLAWQLGQHCFGENYLQELLGKAGQLADLDCEWHFIGPLQSNKSRPVAERCAWLHSLDRASLAHRLNAQRPARLAPLNVCIQVNLSGEPGKSGIGADQLPALVEVVRALPRLRLRGLMTLPAPAGDLVTQRRPFAELRRLQARIGGCDTLSMGMTNDLEAAIAEGATLVRVGTALFGPRPPK